jgi:hypothetical protein
MEYFEKSRLYIKINGYDLNQSVLTFIGGANAVMRSLGTVTSDRMSCGLTFGNGVENFNDIL